MGNSPSNSKSAFDPSNPHPELSLLRFGRIPHSTLVYGLITAVATNHVSLLKILLLTRVSLNVTDSEGNTLLHIAIFNNSLSAFKFLVKRNEIDKNAPNLHHVTALIVAALSGQVYYVKKLIKKGANVNVRDARGCTPLHYAIQFGSSEMCRVLVEAGSDVNVQNLAGKTPMYIACQYRKQEVIHILLYHEADVSTPCENGTIPLMVDNFNSLDLELRIILYNYTFDDVGCIMELKSVVRAMMWPLFPLILSKLTSITYEKDDLQDLSNSLIDIKHEHFKLFLDKFAYVVTDMLRHCCTLTSYLTAFEGMKRITPEIIQFFYVFSQADLVYELVQSSCPSMSPISSLAKIFHKSRLPLDALTELICCLLSYGLNVTPSDLNAVYVFYGRCELFEIMLHMDIKTPTDLVPCCTLYDHEVILKSIMPYFIYDVNLNIDTFLQNPKSYLLMDLDVLLEYFSGPKLKDFFLDNGTSDKVDRKIKMLPTVPTLVELARNSARDYIIQRLAIKNSSQFYTALNRIPINKVYKRIISYEKKLYFLEKC